MSLNPRTLLLQKNGKKELLKVISASGYVPQKIPFNAMCNAIFRASPILLEGHRGGGKTAFPEALAESLGLRLFTLSCLEDTTSDHILFSWDTNGQNHFLTQELAKGIPVSESQKKQWGFDFVKLGEVLDGFHYASRSEVPPVILIDEIDKLSQDAEATLLQILARGYANIPKLRPEPRIGFPPGFEREKKYKSYPIVVLTSNNLGSGVSSPLRSRGRYSFIPAPTLEEIINILAARVPEAHPKMLHQTCKLVDGVRGLPLLEKPALREFIELLQTFVAYGYQNLTSEIIESNIDCLAKTKKDVEAVYDAVDMLYHKVNSENEVIYNQIRKIQIEKKGVTNGT